MPSKLDIVLNSIPNWKPTYYIPFFGIKAIQRIVKCDTREAVDILDSLIYLGAIPTKKWGVGK